MNILIPGTDSYVGNSIAAYLEKNGGHRVEFADVRNDGWRERDFSHIDSAILVAAIVHRKDIDDIELYKKVNILLPRDLAMYLKKQGVPHFVFISTSAVFGFGKILSQNNAIDKSVPLTPIGLYGQSKFFGEMMVQKTENESFRVAVIRPMSIYGKGCHGNYIPTFIKLTKRFPFLPKAYTDVKQGLLYIDNLCELCRLIVDSKARGTYHAQDRECPSTYEIMSAMAEGLNKKKLSLNIQWLAKMFSRNHYIVKLFGGIRYEDDFAKCELGDYQLVSFEDGMRETVRQDQIIGEKTR